MPDLRVLSTAVDDGLTVASFQIPIAIGIASVTANPTGFFITVPESPTGAVWKVKSVVISKEGTAGDRQTTVDVTKQPAGGGSAVSLFTTVFTAVAAANYKNSVTGDASITGGTLNAANLSLAAGDRLVLGGTY